MEHSGNPERMLQLHFYSNHAGRLVLGGGNRRPADVLCYPLESIKEFEQISEAWKRLLAELLKKGGHPKSLNLQPIS